MPFSSTVKANVPKKLTAVLCACSLSSTIKPLSSSPRNIYNITFYTGDQWSAGPLYGSAIAGSASSLSTSCTATGIPLSLSMPAARNSCPPCSAAKRCVVGHPDPRSEPGPPRHSRARLSLRQPGRTRVDLSDGASQGVTRLSHRGRGLRSSALLSRRQANSSALRLPPRCAACMSRPAMMTWRRSVMDLGTARPHNQRYGYEACHAERKAQREESERRRATNLRCDET